MVIPIPHTVLHYTEDDVMQHGVRNGRRSHRLPKSVCARSSPAARLVRLELGLFGDFNALEGGLFELRIEHGQG